MLPTVLGLCTTAPVDAATVDENPIPDGPRKATRIQPNDLPQTSKENPPSRLTPKEWPVDRLPEFSQYVQPLLNGVVMSDQEHKRLCRQMRDELILYLDENQLISTGSKAQRRWEYKSLGDALVRKFPCLSWENPGPKTKIYKQRTQIFTVFMHKLATTRKVRKFRNSKPAVLAGPVLPTITKEQAMAELNALSAPSFKEATVDAARVKQLLILTANERNETFYDELPPYFLLEEILTCEAELRFGTPMPVLEDTLKKAVVAASDVLEKVCTFQDVEKQIQPHGAKHFLISEMEVPEDVVFNSPHIYFSSEKILVHGGKPHELIRVNGTTENALVMCLALYYIKNLNYPQALAQPLIFLQKFLRPRDNVPRGLMNGKLRSLLEKIKQ
uniref:Uncharacterized protein n=2 Tax=Ixodes ricinus TaxID=34613 RepID=V5H5J2_IXORI